MPLSRAAAATLRRPHSDPLVHGTGAALSIGLCAVIVAASEHEPRVLTLHFAASGGSPAEALPSGPLEAEHRTLEIGLRSWVERLGLAFGRHGASWNEELVLERYELLYEAGLVAEAARDLGREPGSVGGTTPGGSTGVAMASDHRRIMATAIGRLRGKIKYRP